MAGRLEIKMVWGVSLEILVTFKTEVTSGSRFFKKNAFEGTIISYDTIKKDIKNMLLEERSVNYFGPIEILNMSILFKDMKSE